MKNSVIGIIVAASVVFSTCCAYGCLTFAAEKAAAACEAVLDAVTEAPQTEEAWSEIPETVEIRMEGTLGRPSRRDNTGSGMVTFAGDTGSAEDSGTDWDSGSGSGYAETYDDSSAYDDSSYDYSSYDDGSYDDSYEEEWYDEEWADVVDAPSGEEEYADPDDGGIPWDEIEAAAESAKRAE